MKAILFNLKTRQDDMWRTFTIGCEEIEIINFQNDSIYYSLDGFLKTCVLGINKEIYICESIPRTSATWDKIYSILAKRYTTSYTSINWSESYHELFKAHQRAHQGELLEAMTGESC